MNNQLTCQVQQQRGSMASTDNQRLSSADRLPSQKLIFVTRKLPRRLWVVPPVASMRGPRKMTMSILLAKNCAIPFASRHGHAMSQGRASTDVMWATTQLRRSCHARHASSFRVLCSKSRPWRSRSPRRRKRGRARMGCRVCRTWSRR